MKMGDCCGFGNQDQWSFFCGGGLRGAKMFRVLVVGPSHVGKTTLICNNADREVCTSYTSTIGVDVKEKVTSVGDETVRLQLWDTAGHEQFRTLTQSYYGSADGIVLVYDVTRRESFDAVHFWALQVSHNKSNIVRMLIGNKSDLASGNDRREVSTALGEKIAESCGMLFWETSAKTGDNVENAFDELASALLLMSYSQTKQTSPRHGNGHSHGRRSKLNPFACRRLRSFSVLIASSCREICCCR